MTGAGKRVGWAIAHALLADGWTVVAHVRRAGDKVPEGAVAVAADLAGAGAADTIIGASEGLPPLDLLVNNAARFGEDRLETLDSASFDSHMAVNVRAPALLTQAFAKALASKAGGAKALASKAGGAGGGLVVNLLDAKLAAPNPDYLSYTLSKMALAGLTELSARALAGQGIRVNGIAPALMLLSDGQDEANFAAMHRFNPLQRGVEPADVIAALRYLIDAAAVTGQIITIDGGQRFWALPRDVQFLEKK